MPQPRRAAKILERSGAWKKDPQRRRKDVPGNGKLTVDPPPQLELEPFEAALWSEVVRAIPVGIGTASDALTVELVVYLLAKVRIRKASSNDIAQLRALYGTLGLSPSARASLGPLLPREENPFDAL